MIVFSPHVASTSFLPWKASVSALMMAPLGIVRATLSSPSGTRTRVGTVMRNFPAGISLPPQSIGKNGASIPPTVRGRVESLAACLGIDEQVERLVQSLRWRWTASGTLEHGNLDKTRGY